MTISQEDLDDCCAAEEEAASVDLLEQYAKEHYERHRERSKAIKARRGNPAGAPSLN